MRASERVTHLLHLPCWMRPNEPGRVETRLALRAARAAGDVVRACYADSRGRRGVLKKDATPVTEADVASHWLLRKHLGDACPGDAVVSEEDGHAPRVLGSRTWLVDPLDGTRDFLARTGEFCVHVALVEDGACVLGVVHEPVSGATWWAERGGGAWLQHEGQDWRLQVSHATELEHARIGISRTNPVPPLRAFLAAHGLASNARPMGASTKLMAVARGHLDAVINLSTAEMPWDIAAPLVILEEAGGTFTHADGSPFTFSGPLVPAHRGTLASQPRLHGTLVRALAGYLP